MGTLRKIGQGEFEYIYQSAIARMAVHPERAERETKIVEEHPYYKSEQEALQAAIDMENSGCRGCQIWAKIGRDEEYYYIQDYFIVSNDNIVLRAAEYIGMAQVYV